MCLSTSPSVHASSSSSSVVYLPAEECDSSRVTRRRGPVRATATKKESTRIDEAKAHDYFNLIALLPMIALNAMNWNWSMLLRVFTDPATVTTFQDAWTDEWFALFSFYTLSYFVVDLCYILRNPICVKSPVTIVQHHIVSLIYLSTPIFYPSFRYAMGLGLSVELNTWLLIARRRFQQYCNRRLNEVPTHNPTTTVSSHYVMMIQRHCVSVLFYSTWFVIRLGLYPYLWIDILRRYNHLSATLGTRLNIWLLILPLHTIFMLMNFKWTMDLSLSKIRYWKRRHDSKDDGVSKGL